MSASSRGAFWLATAALLRRHPNDLSEDDHASVCQHARDNWEDCIAQIKSATVICTVLEAAFEDISSLPMNQLASLATRLLEKSIIMGGREEFLALLELLRTPLERRPGLLHLLAHVAIHHCSSETDMLKKLRITEVLTWLADACQDSPAFIAFAETLAVARAAVPAMPLVLWLLSPVPPLCALKLAGMCCEVSLTATRTLWARLDSLLRSPQTDEVYYIAAAALFHGLSSHILSFTSDSNSDTTREHALAHQEQEQEQEEERAIGALCDALTCGIPSIQLPAAVAVGRVLYHPEVREKQWIRRVYEAVHFAVQSGRGSGSDNRVEDIWGGWGQRAPGGGTNNMQQGKHVQELGEVLQACERLCTPIMDRET